MAAKETATNNATASTDTPPPCDPIPGSDIIGRGIYIRPRQPYELKPVYFKRASDCTSYTRPATNKTYSVPDGCAVNPSPPLPADQSFGQTLIEESWSRFGKQLTVNAAASVSGKSVSIDASAFQANSVKSDEDSYYALRSSFVPLWDLYMPSIPNDLSDELEKQIPANWNNEDKFDWGNRDAYAKIFDRYGTHFVKNVWVGGKASLVFTVAKSSNLKTHEIRAAIQASLGQVAKGSVSVEQKTSEETFRSNTSCKVFGSGGNGTLLAKLSKFEEAIYNAWLESVEPLPAVIQLGVVGIWTLVNNKEKAEILKEAYIQESQFVPLTAIVPIGRYYIFLKDSWGFALDYSESPYGSQRKKLSSVDYEVREGFWKVAEGSAWDWEKDNALKEYLNFGEKSKNSPEKGKGFVKKPDLEEYKALKEKALGKAPDAWMRLEDITKLFVFLNDNRYKDFSRPQAALSLSVVKASGDPKKNWVYLFKHRRCLLIDFNNVKTLADVKPLYEYPQDLSDVFPGVDFDRIDAALAIPPNKLYLFSGPNYYRIEESADGTFKVTAKEKIIKGWPGVDFERLDTATYWKNNKVYFFYEDQYTRYDVSNHRADPGYPKHIPSNYVEDWDFFD